jgi:hypothetical protein
MLSTTETNWQLSIISDQLSRIEETIDYFSICTIPSGPIVMEQARQLHWLCKWCQVSSLSGEDPYGKPTCSLANEEDLSIVGACILFALISMITLVYWPFN